MFAKVIADGYQVIERTQFCDEQTHEQTHMQEL